MSRAPALIDYINAELLSARDDRAVTEDDELLTTERIDSLGLMRLIAFIGSEFQIQVPYEDILIENFRTVRAIDEYLAGADREVRSTA